MCTARHHATLTTPVPALAARYAAQLLACQVKGISAEPRTGVDGGRQRRVHVRLPYRLRVVVRYISRVRVGALLQHDHAAVGGGEHSSGYAAAGARAHHGDVRLDDDQQRVIGSLSAVCIRGQACLQEGAT